jgi:hypothetical protein
MNTWRKSFEINVFHFWISSIYSNKTLNSRIRLNDNSYEWNIFIEFLRIFDMRRSIKKTISSNSFTSCIKNDIFFKSSTFFFELSQRFVREWWSNFENVNWKIQSQIETFHTLARFQCEKERKRSLWIDEIVKKRKSEWLNKRWRI